MLIGRLLLLSEEWTLVLLLFTKPDQESEDSCYTSCFH
jgi:hypothetical protein